jgi:hypothetical protein
MFFSTDCEMQNDINANVANAGGFQRQGATGAVAANLLQALGNAGSGVLPLSRRVKKDGL